MIGWLFFGRFLFEISASIQTMNGEQQADALGVINWMADPIPWVPNDQQGVAAIEQLIEETQRSIDALKPGEYIMIRPTLPRHLQFASWHVLVNSMLVIHAGFDVIRTFYFDAFTKPNTVNRADGEIMILGENRFAVFEGKLVYYDSFKAAAKAYNSQTLDLLYQKEKYRKYKRRTDAIIVEMRSQLAQLWYSPGMPGAKEASEHFASIKPDEEPFY